MAELKSELFVRPRLWLFGADEQEQLAQKLRDVDRKTLVVTPRRPQDLQIKYDGTTKSEGYRYTDLAFQQICRAASVGLSRLVADVAGQYGHEARERACDFRIATDIFNKVLELRFNQTLSMRQIVFNRDAMLIEGVLGPRTAFLENVRLLEMVRDALPGGQSTRFQGGALAGRQLTLRYRQLEPLFIAPGPVSDPLYIGYHISNTESGDASIRGGKILYRQLSDSAALQPTKTKLTDRLFHTGSNFMLRLQALVEDITAPAPWATRVARWVERLLATPLGINTETSATIQQSTATLIRSLGVYGLSIRLAERAVRRAIYLGSYETGDKEAYRTPRAAMARRTLYDLFTALGAEGRQLHIAAREQLERAAFDVLTGKLFGDKHD